MQRTHKSEKIIILGLLFTALFLLLLLPNEKSSTLTSSSSSAGEIYLSPLSYNKKEIKGINTLYYKSLRSPRSLALQIYLKRHGSPLAQYADLIVSTADKYNQDWRIVVAIAGVESAFGTITPKNSFNAWGWRGGPDGAFSVFRDWPHAIDYYTKYFTQGYGVNPDPFAIEGTYCPPCGRNPAHAWAQGVSRYKNEITQVYQELLQRFPQLRNVK